MFLRRQLPTTIGSYRVLRRLADYGSYADYLATHNTLGHDLLLRHELNQERQSPESQPALEALRRARRLQADIHHPRIVPVVDFFEVEGEWFSVFVRLTDAIELDRVCQAIRTGRQRRFTMPEYLALCEGITDALAAVHDRGYVHRTLNLRNILVDASGSPLLFDMGCAIAMDQDDEASHAAHYFMTAFTAAPEQLSEECRLSPATDIWALGVVFYFIRYQRHPFGTTEMSAQELLGAIVTRALAFPQDYDEANGEPAFTGENGLDPSPASYELESERLLRPWLARLLEKDPSQRYQDALEARRDLKTIVAKLDTRQPLARSFVAMPFTAEFDNLWRVIESACVEFHIKPVRVDQSITNENIWDEICTELQSADLMIAVASPHREGAPNPNVMVEIGYMRALQRPILILTSDPETLPFDLRTQRALIYSMGAETDPTFHRRLRANLGAMLDRLTTSG